MEESGSDCRFLYDSDLFVRLYPSELMLISEPTRLGNPEAYPVKTGLETGRFVMTITFTPASDWPVGRQDGPPNFTDLPEFQAGMAALFDPKVTGDNLKALEAERARLMAENTATQADLLTASTAERLGAKARLDKLNEQIRIARIKHDAANAVVTDKATRAPQFLSLPKEPALPPPVDYRAKKLYTSDREQKMAAAAEKVAALEAEIAEVRAGNTANIAELMHGSIVERRQARRELAGLRFRLAAARTRLALVSYPVPDYLRSYIPEGLLSERPGRISRLFGAVALRKAVSYPE